MEHSRQILKGGDYVGKSESSDDKIYFCQSQQLSKLTKKEYLALRELCRVAKNMYNVGLYNVRQHFFNTGQYLNYNKNYDESKTNENYMMLNSNCAQQILKSVDEAFKSFFALNALVKEGRYPADAVKIPHYLPKEGFYNYVVGQI